MFSALLRPFATPMFRRAPSLPRLSGAVFALLLFFALLLPPDRVRAFDAASEPDIFSVPGTGLSLTGQLPSLTILYNAMTHGELHPCPT